MRILSAMRPTLWISATSVLLNAQRSNALQNAVSRAKFLTSTAFLVSSAAMHPDTCEAKQSKETAATSNPRYIEKEMQMLYGEGRGMFCNFVTILFRDCTSSFWQMGILDPGVFLFVGLQETRRLSSFQLRLCVLSKNGHKSLLFDRRTFFVPTRTTTDGSIAYRSLSITSTSRLSRL